MPRNYILITATIVLVFLFIFSLTSDSTSLTWRKVLHKSTRIMRPYQAPLHGCDGLKEDIVSQSYMVFLHKGYSLEQHKRTVGEAVDLDSAIKSVFPETALFGLEYHAQLDDTALAAVRADLAVDLVECNRKIGLNPVKSGQFPNEI